MVSTLALSGIVFTIMVSTGLPIAVGIFFCVRHRAKLLSIVTGMAVFVVFALILESIVHYFCNPATVAALQNPWLYSIYGGLTAGIFEEGGRFLAFLFILKKLTDWKDGVGYGIGHGGIEAIVVGGLGNLNYLIFALLINGGSFGELLSKAGPAGSDAVKQLSEIRDSLISASPSIYAISGVERLSAFALQIALSLIVLYCVKNRRYIFLLYAVLIHAAVDFPAALYQNGIIGIWAAESVIVIVGIASFVFILLSKKLFAGPDGAGRRELPAATR